MSSCRTGLSTPDHDIAEMLAADFVQTLFVQGDVTKAAAGSAVYLRVLSRSEEDYMHSLLAASASRLGGKPTSIRLETHIDAPQTGTIVLYYRAEGANLQSTSYTIQLTQDRHGLLIRAAFIGERAPPPDQAHFKSSAYRDLVRNQ